MKRADRVTLLLVLSAVLAISTAYGMLLLLPLFIKQQLHGNEADYGLLTASAAITTVVAIGLLIRFPRRLPPNRALAIASLVYAGAAVAVSMVHSIAPLIGIGIVLGTAWALAYTAAPMIVSELCDDRTRARYIGYATGMIQVGFGLGPVIGNALRSLPASFADIFQVAAALAVLAAILAAPLDRRSPALRARPGDASGVRVGDSLRATLFSPAFLSICMVVMCACLFTTMNSFQTTFAAVRHLNYDVFYVSYTLSVIFVRFVLVRALRDSAAPGVLLVSALGIVVSLLLFLAVGHSAFRYGLSSVLLGMTYGLTLPAVQARTVNLSAAAYRPSMLPLAGLVFETAVLVFPLVAGAIVSASSYTILFIVLLGLAVGIALAAMRERFRSPRVAPAGQVRSPVPRG